MSLSRAAFEALVREALEDVPEEFLTLLQQVPIVVEEEADFDTMAAMGLEADADLYGLYDGIPLTERRSDDIGLPDRILVFRRPLVEDFPDPQELRREVRITVLHEIAHHFGIGEERLRELGLE